MPPSQASAPAKRKSTAEAMIDEVRKHAQTIDQNPFGRLLVEWQDGRLVALEVTTKHRPAS